MGGSEERAGPRWTVHLFLFRHSRGGTGCGSALLCFALTTPDHLRAGDIVKVQLWLEGEEAFIDIRLAQVRRVHKHWIGVEVIQLSSDDRMRLKRFLDAAAAMHLEEPARIDHLLIRA